MFMDPSWYPAHLLLLVGLALTTVPVVGLARTTPASLPVWVTRLAAVASAVATAAMVLHLIAKLDDTNCYLAAHGVYFVAHYAAPSFPSLLYEAIFAPASRTGLLPLWPDPSPSEVVRWPQAPVDHKIALTQSTHVMRVVEAIGLPEEGLNRDEIARVTQEFRDGAEPWELRDRFAGRTT